MQWEWNCLWHWLHTNVIEELEVTGKWHCAQSAYGSSETNRWTRSCGLSYHIGRHSPENELIGILSVYLALVLFFFRFDFVGVPPIKWSTFTFSLFWDTTDWLSSEIGVSSWILTDFEDMPSLSSKAGSLLRFCELCTFIVCSILTGFEHGTVCGTGLLGECSVVLKCEVGELWSKGEKE